MRKLHSPGPSSLWRWISIRMIGLALMVILIVGLGMWYRFLFWESSHRLTLPPAIQAELQVLEERRAANPDLDIPRLKQIYGEYLYGEYFAPRVIREDLIVIFSLVLISLPLVIGGGIWVSRRLSRQLGAVAVAAQQISEGSFDARAQINGDAPEALRSLAIDFNRMAERLERYDQELQISSAAIAHELRTPLNAAKGRVKALLDGVFDPSPENLRIVMRQLDQINRLTDDLYLLSLASAGELNLFKSEFALGVLLEERVSWEIERLEAQGVKVSIDVPADLFVSADRDRLGQVLSILIDNALQYASGGKWLGLVSSQSDGQVSIVVRDSGPGFPVNAINRVCDRFWRAESSRARNKGGGGLGLSVAAAICQAHGGSIIAKNREGGGAEVLVVLPGS